MKHEDIIAKKIELLQAGDGQNLPEEMQQLVDSSPELASEISFMEALWQADNHQPVEQPSQQMDARFYQMLSQTQSELNSAKPPLEATTKNKPDSTLSGWLTRLFNPQPLATMALLVMVFGLGYVTNNTSPEPTPHVSAVVSKLEQKIETLNTMVALNMLNDQSASGRLAGVSYSMSNQANGKVTQTLLQLLNSDSSSAVRLAIVDTVSQRLNEEKLQNQLLDSITKQDSPIVQIALIQLLLKDGSQTSKKQIYALLENNQLIDEVADYLNVIKTPAQEA
ncbi:hypothetical protein [Aliikangiella coralliicola]|uniref:HEAT repeat domain-containing protein n=1 Tax=Aliikangiella coralliicola TaxID=2592383 RepID=A0A545U8M9_9GAMM|nr:hypothetical protein [Aliikangiella coralliicola]TQV85824.1 hypothetical protein FLL46_18025 [Aliikangiella coralliicola]